MKTMRKIMIKKIDINEIKRVYIGKNGCTCGCLGDYSEEPQQIRRVVNFLNMIHDMGCEDVSRESGGYFYHSKNKTYMALFD